MSRSGESTGPSTWQYVVVAVVAVLVGAYVAPQVASTFRERPDRVVVVSVEGPITSSSVEAISEDLRQARRNGKVKAVVLRIDSPGGAVAASESLYLAVNRTARQMPVVASVSGLGASGAYYGMVPADRIYVTPGSIVGSVGVIARNPGSEGPGNEIATGPDKPTGGTTAEIRTRIETMRRAFVDSVYFHRGDRLELSREELSYAKVYTGARATQNGVADRVGGIDTAIAYAASAAGIDRYRVVRKEPPRPQGPVLFGQTENGNRTVVVRGDPFGYDGVETTRYLALYGQVRTEEVMGDGSD